MLSRWVKRWSAWVAAGAAMTKERAVLRRKIMQHLLLLASSE
jgi:hypothetical protein